MITRKRRSHIFLPLLIGLILTGCSSVLIQRSAPEDDDMTSEVIKALQSRQTYAISYQDEKVKESRTQLGSETGMKNLLQALNAESSLTTRGELLLAQSLVLRNLQSDIGSGMLGLSTRISDVADRLEAASEQSKTSETAKRRFVTSAQRIAEPLLQEFKKRRPAQLVEDLAANTLNACIEIEDTLQDIAGKNSTEFSTDTLKGLAERICTGETNLRTAIRADTKRIQEERDKVEKELDQVRGSASLKALETLLKPTSPTLAAVPTAAPQEPLISKELRDDMRKQIADAKRALAELAYGGHPDALNAQSRYVQDLERNYARVEAEHQREMKQLQTSGVYTGLPLKKAKSESRWWHVFLVEGYYNTSVAEGGAVVTTKGETTGIVGLPVALLRDMVKLVREIFSGESTPELVGAAATGATLISR